jgi:hypothetical protein
MVVIFSSCTYFQTVLKTLIETVASQTGEAKFTGPCRQETKQYLWICQYTPDLCLLGLAGNIVDITKLTYRLQMVL